MTNSHRSRSFKLLFVKLIHFAASIALFYVFWLLFRYGRLNIFPADSTGFRYNYYAAGFYAVLLYWLNRTYNSYLFGYNRLRSLIFSQIIAQVFSAGIVYIATSVAWNRFSAPWVFFMLFALQLVLDLVWTHFGSIYFVRLTPPRKTLLVYRNQLDKRRFGVIRGKPIERLYQITDEICYDGNFHDLEDRIRGYDAIFVAGVNSRCRNGILKYCKENNVVGFFLPHVGDVIMQEAKHIQSFDSPVLRVSRKELNPEYVIAKRAFDLILSGLALVILSPVILVTAAAVHFYDGGPAFYRQVRLTRDSKEFKILKFRSMRVDAEKDGVARLSSGDSDSRITPIGRFIRKTRLDELPQLVNIFLGDMSFVGPRPERPEIAKVYYETLPDFRLRLQVKAGLTGYAQIYGKYNTEPYEKLEFDLLYINRMSFLTDLQLCFATFAILFKKESTQGISESQTTAMNFDAPEEAPSSQTKES